MTAAVGIIANPAAGKDIRRLVAAASPISDMAKVGIVRRSIIGAVEGGADRVVLADDRRSLGRRAAEAVGAARGEAEIEILDLPVIDSRLNTVRAAAHMARAGVGAVVALGGDGTQRDVVSGWRDAPLVPLSTGTNNVFPHAHEATVAGHAAGLVAAGLVALEAVARRAKTIEVTIDDAAGPELALVDVALVDTQFTASRAVWDPADLRDLVVAIAEPAAVGLSSIAAALRPTDRDSPGGVHVRFGPGHSVRVPLAPGLYHDVQVARCEPVHEGIDVALRGPGTLSFDGERDVVLAPGRRATVRITRTGPLVIDVDATMNHHAEAMVHMAATA